MTDERRRRGFVLLVVLVILAMVAVNMVTVSRRSLDMATEAAIAHESFQDRWAFRSCVTFVLTQADKVLQQKEARSGVASGRWTASLEFNGRPVVLSITDEQAKLHVGHGVTKYGRRDTESRARALVANMRRSPRVRLRPTTESAAVAGLGLIGSYGQMFDGASIESIGPQLGDAWGEAPSDVVTCWGDGRTNYRRAPQAVLQAAVSHQLEPEEINALLSTIRRNPGSSFDSVTRTAGLTRTRSMNLSAAITDRSECFALWFISGPSTYRRCRFAVLDGTQSIQKQPLVFEW